MERPSRRALVIAGAAGAGVVVAAAGTTTALAAGSIYARAARRRLARVLHRQYDPETAKALLRAFDTQLSLIPRDETARAGRLRLHAENARIAEALYRAHRAEHYERELAVDKVHWLLWDALLATPSRVVATAMQEGEDPFAHFGHMQHLVLRTLYPHAGFDWRWNETEEGFKHETTRCYYADVFTRRGVPELTRAFCDLESREAELMSSWVAAERVAAMTSGADGRCDLLYRERRAA